MKRELIILIGLVLIIFSLNYPVLDSAVVRFLDDSKIVKIERVIDGDTIETSNKEIVRLLGINTPERGENYYSEAKDFLENKTLGKQVRLEFVGDKMDKYHRTLAYVFLGGENINIELVKKGLANYYFYSGRDKYSSELENAWEECLNQKINLCEPSNHQCSSCVVLESNKLINNCSFGCDISVWEVKTEGRDKFVFEISLDPYQEKVFDLGLENSGGSLFLRDSTGRLVLWGNY